MTVRPINELNPALPPEIAAMNPTIDPEMKAFIIECAGDGMTAKAICGELHRLGFSWVKVADVDAVIEGGES